MTRESEVTSTASLKYLSRYGIISSSKKSHTNKDGESEDAIQNEENRLNKQTI